MRRKKQKPETDFDAIRKELQGIVDDLQQMIDDQAARSMALSEAAADEIHVDEP